MESRCWQLWSYFIRTKLIVTELILPSCIISSKYNAHACKWSLFWAGISWHIFWVTQLIFTCWQEWQNIFMSIWPSVIKNVSCSQIRWNMAFVILRNTSSHKIFIDTDKINLYQGIKYFFLLTLKATFLTLNPTLLKNVSQFLLTPINQDSMIEYEI